MQYQVVWGIIKMQRFVRSMIAIIISYLIIYGITSVTGFDFWWLSLLVCFACGYPVLYIGGSTHYVEKEIKREYILDLHNDKIGDLFVSSQYPKYKKTNSGVDGNDYMSDAGSIICTKYVTKKESVKVNEKGFSVHMFCVLMCIFSFLLWSSMKDAPPLRTNINYHVTMVSNNIKQMSAEGIASSFSQGDNNLQIAVKSIKELFQSGNDNLKTKINLGSEMGNLTKGWNEMISRISGNFRQLIVDIEKIF